MEELISVIIPVYNAENYLERCLNSICNQKYQNYEVLLIDDGSKDNSYSILKKYTDRFENFISFKNTNHGVSYTRNFALQKAKGSLVCFVDSDDEIDENYLFDFIQEYKTSNVDCICTGYEEINMYNQRIKRSLYNNDILINKDQFSNLYKLFITGKFGTNNIYNKLYKMSIIKDNNLLFNESISNSEDMEFVLKYLKYCDNFKYICKYNYFYYFNENSITNCFDENQLENHLLWKKILFENIDNEILKRDVDSINKLSIMEVKSYLCNACIHGIKITYSDLLKYDEILNLCSDFRLNDFSSIEEKIFFISLKIKQVGLFNIFFHIKLFLRKRLVNG